MFRIFRVRGNSMQPTLNEGDYVVAFSRFITRFLKPKTNKLVVVDHPEHGVMVKRVLQSSNECIRLVGDNKQDSLSTEAMGELAYEHVLGRVCFVSKKRRS